uniref:Uncharacterized protein n=1 Tax=Sus scrofa TaxID=9823 RepID=A0A8D1CRI8_PIG
MSSNSFLVASLGLPVYTTMSFALTVLCLPIWILFISFSSLIAMARTSKSMLNNSGKSRHPCLVPDLSRTAFSFSPLRMMLAVGLSAFSLFIFDL